MDFVGKSISLEKIKKYIFLKKVNQSKQQTNSGPKINLDYTTLKNL